MTEDEARNILGDAITDDNKIVNGYPFTLWQPTQKEVLIDGDCTIEFLEAVVWWMKNKAT